MTWRWLSSGGAVSHRHVVVARVDGRIARATTSNCGVDVPSNLLVDEEEGVRRCRRCAAAENRAAACANGRNE